ncbi:MAG TPA: DNA mismatch repair endonuclease MutL, partial [Nitrolancea sp.]|nr:DNA mismatch repair endonuclease MutL [Nitrolancea sp.]
ISAGEVIERPASVVKELVENALDAHARSLVIDIAAGGKELIRVRDDGDGIPPAELTRAVERHTTSKLQSFEDLKRLTSFGFRGEALASVAAVSDLQILSRTADGRAGWQLRSEFGRRSEPTQIAAAQGTSITARDLFANVPARRKFLRQDATEAGYIQRVIGAYALAFPEIRFELNIDGKPVMVTDGSGDLASAAVGVFGATVAAQMVPLDELVETGENEEAGVKIGGLIGLPSVTRGNRQQLILLVNRRWIENRSVAFALEQSYHTLVMVGRYPIAVVNITVPPDRVDVNVHPTKREVRFTDERIVFSSLQRAARGTLMQHTPVQSIPLMIDSPLSSDTVQRRMALANPERLRSAPPLFASDSSEPQLTDDRVRTPAADEPDIPMLRVLGQVSSTYIIAEGPDGMYLVDQHAAHERILLEKVLKLFARGSAESQQLLEPLVIDLSPELLATAESADEELRQLGFELQPFGQGSVALRSIPAIMARKDPTKTVTAILDEIGRGGRGTSRFEAVAMTTACHSAIRAGQTLSLGEMRELLAQLEGCTAPRACAHGRPTILHLSQDELERQFSRR